MLEPLNAFLNTIWGFVPSLLAAGALFLVAWIVATSQEILDMAFTLALGAIAIAVALAFGLGGREVAGREVERFLSSFRGESE